MGGGGGGGWSARGIQKKMINIIVDRRALVAPKLFGSTLKVTHEANFSSN